MVFEIDNKGVKMPMLELLPSLRQNGGLTADSGIITGNQWQYYVTDGTYWRKWVELNRN